MQSIDIIVRDNPTKTGAEILAIQQRQIEADDKAYQKANEKTLKFIEDINKNGGYYRGTFGESQYYYYSFTDLIFDKRVYGKCEKIVCFKRGNISDGVSIEKRVENFHDIDTYGLLSEERITKDEYDKISKYIDEAFNIFW